MFFIENRNQNRAQNNNLKFCTLQFKNLTKIIFLTKKQKCKLPSKEDQIAGVSAETGSPIPLRVREEQDGGQPTFESFLRTLIN